MPDIDAAELRGRLASKRRFVWLKREITAEQRAQIHRLGIPGIGFLPENKRIYPNGAEVSHVLGHVNIDNQGTAGIEKWLDARGLADLHLAGLATDRLQTPVELAVDLRVQHALRDELIAARAKFKAVAAAGVLTDVRTGEIVSMVSEPDYDPNNPREALDPTRINRLTTGVYEMGSTFKALTLAMALDSGKITLKSAFDASHPLQYGKFAIHDFHAQNRVLTVPEIFTYSSNIGTARMALSLGIEHHKWFLRKTGPARPAAHRIAGKRRAARAQALGRAQHGDDRIRPRAFRRAAAGGDGDRRADERRHLIPPTFLKRSESEALALATQVIKPETSEKMRYLMRLNVEKGTATKADVKGYYVGGKTGTADKVVGGRYSKTKVLTSFTAVLPADQPRYLLLIMLDEPQATPDTHGFTTSGWNAVPVGGAVIARIAPLLGLEPRFELPPADKLILASAGGR
jgi:cell division protein FtsI (penicillin-binding protein 3)